MLPQIVQTYCFSFSTSTRKLWTSHPFFTHFSLLLPVLGSKSHIFRLLEVWQWGLGKIGARYTLWVGSQWRTTWGRRITLAAIALSTNSLEAIFVFLFTTIVMSASRAALSSIQSAIKKHNVVVFSKTTCPRKELKRWTFTKSNKGKTVLRSRWDYGKRQNENAGLPIEIFLSWWLS